MTLLFRSSLAIAIAVCAAALFTLHWQLIHGSVVIDVFEGVQPHFTALLAAGQNPYEPGHQPLYTNAYPPLYNAICALLLPLADSSLALHRGVTGLFIVLSCCLLFLSAKRAGADTVLGLCAAVLLYAALQYYSTVVASSNSMGTFFFLLSVLLPWRYKFNHSSLIVSAACVVAAFFSKQYFALGLVIVSAYVIFFVSVKTGIVYALAAGISLVASIALTNSIAPFFLENILFAMGNVVDAIDNNSSMVDQLWFFSKYYSALILAVVLAYALPYFKCEASADADLNRASRGYFLFAFIVALLAVVFVLGRNPGNYMTYLFQLMSPFFILYMIGLLASRPRTILLAPLLIANLFVAYNNLPKETEPDLTNWHLVYDHIRHYDNILNSSILTYALMQESKKVNNGGLDSMFRFATLADTPLQNEDRRQRALQVWQNYKQSIRSGVIEKRFDALMIQPGEMNHLILEDQDRQGKGSAGRFLRQYYTLHDSFELSLTDRRGGGTFPMQIWLPKS